MLRVLIATVLRWRGKYIDYELIFRKRNWIKANEKSCVCSTVTIEVCFAINRADKLSTECFMHAGSTCAIFGSWRSDYWRREGNTDFFASRTAWLPFKVSFVGVSLYSAMLFIRSFVHQSISQSVSQTVSHSGTQSINQSVNQSIITQSVNQSVSQSVSQSINQTNNHSINKGRLICC